MKHRELRKFLVGFCFIGPNFIGFFIFTLIPIVFTAILSFCDWSIQEGFSGMEFIGFQNYIEAFSDVWVSQSFINNAVYTLIVMPVTLTIAFLLSYFILQLAYIKKLLRLCLFLPYVTNIVAITSVWMMIFQPTYGPINGFLLSLGIENPPGWLSSSTYALPTIALLEIWRYTGYNMVLYLAGMQGIPEELKEAATIDGATKGQVVRHIILPLLTPTTFFLLVTGMIHSFMVFAPVSIMTQGGPGSATSVIIYYIYTSAFQYYKMGYAAAISILFFIVIFFITCLQWIGQKKWVNYF